jgi:hypothetical protein
MGVTRVTSSVPALLGSTQSETVMKIDDGLCEYSLPLKMSGDPPFPLRMGVTRVTSSVPALLGSTQSETVMKIDDGLCEYSLLLKMSGDPPFPLRMGLGAHFH